ncbi:MAG: glycosyltransferase 87 family protein [Candidatus Cybelea sp.]
MKPQRRRAIIFGVLMAALAFAALRDVFRLGEASPWRNMDDFPDFYCAGWALDAKANPYTYEPLRTCEHRVNIGDTFRDRLFRSDPAIAIPAPLPAYDFLPFMAIARLPFGVARALEAAAIVAAVLIGAISLAGLGIPIAVAAAALLLSTAYVELNTGQVVPFALLALILCGVALARGYVRLGGILAVLTAIEPVVGVPVALAMLFYVPRSRAAVLATATIFAVIAVVTVGPAALWEYATHVVPAQASSEIHFPFQFSLTYALARAGVSATFARAAGSLSYLVLLALGLWLAPRAARSLRRRELIVFIPAFCCAVAGPYLHQEELCLALPALLVLAVATTGRARTVFAIALCVLAVPWILVWGIKQLFLASLLCCAVILWQLRIFRWPAIAAFCAIAATIYAFELRPPHLPVPSASVKQTYAATALVQDEWRVYAEQRSTSDLLWFAIKVPTWAALLTTLIVTTRLSLRPDQPSSPRI